MLPSQTPNPLPQTLYPSTPTNPLLLGHEAPLSPQPPRIIRRRPNMEQGHALEVLGHAIEYLVDSRLFLTDEAATEADSEAIHILSRSSRAVFASCEEIVPMSQRLRQWAFGRLGGSWGSHPHPARRN